jgi:hypothetical protein
MTIDQMDNRLNFGNADGPELGEQFSSRRKAKEFAVCKAGKEVW